MHYDNVLVKNAATQSGEFVTCIFGMLYIVISAVERRRLLLSFGLMAVILAMLANIVYVSTGRTALVVISVLLVLFAIKKMSGKGVAFNLCRRDSDSRCCLEFFTIPPRSDHTDLDGGEKIRSDRRQNFFGRTN